MPKLCEIPFLNASPRLIDIMMHIKHDIHIDREGEVDGNIINEEFELSACCKNCLHTVLQRHPITSQPNYVTSATGAFLTLSSMPSSNLPTITLASGLIMLEYSYPSCQSTCFVQQRHFMCSKAEEPTCVQEMFNRSGEQAVLILKSFVRYLDRIIFTLVHKLVLAECVCL